ncbi:MAG: pyruvate kinase [Eggerthellaceae bacterium]
MLIAPCWPNWQHIACRARGTACVLIAAVANIERHVIRMTKRTKIICTLGPAVDSESALKNLIQSGMDVARCNFSHGSHAEHKARMDRLKKYSPRT